MPFYNKILLRQSSTPIFGLVLRKFNRINSIVGFLVCLLCCSALFIPSTILAEDANNHNLKQKYYEIPAGPLDASLNRFASEAGITLSFDPELVKQQNSRSIVGNYTVKNGLKALLENTGLTAVEGISGGYRLIANQDDSSVMGPIVVTGEGSQVELLDSYSGDQVASGGRAGLLGNIDIMDAPFSETSYTQTLIENQQSRSVGDVLQNDPTVRLAKGFGNFQEVYIVRGFPIFSDDLTYNGVFGILPRQFLAAELIERVEVFRGANAFLNGAAPGGGNGSGVGGVINIVPKRAGDEPLTRFTPGFETDGQFSGAFDFSRRFGSNNDFGARLNLVSREGEMSIDDQERSLKVASIATDYQSERLRVYADIGYQDQRLDDPRPQVTPFGNAPSAPDSSDNYAQPWTFTEEEQLFGAVRGEFDITDDVTMWLAFGSRYGEEDNRLGNPSTNEIGVTSTNRFDNYREDTVYSADAGIRFNFETGNVGHVLTVSASGINSDSDNAFEFYLTPFTNDLYDPVDVPLPTAGLFAGGDLSDPKRTEALRNRSIAVADVMSFFDGKLLTTLGIRRQSIDTRTFDFNTGDKLTDYSDYENTPFGALTIKPYEWLSLYANYAESIQPGAIAPAFSGATPIINAGEQTDPFRGEQLEFGFKIDHIDYGMTLSAFELSRPNSIVENGIFSDSGEQESQGIELTVFGEPTQGLRVLGGLTFLDAELKNTAGSIDEGNTPIGLPDRQANINIEWDVPMFAGFTVDGRMVYTDKQYINTSNTEDISSWTRIDLGGRYTTQIANTDVVIRGRIENVADRNYWSSVGGFPGANYLVQGAPRTLIFSASFDF